MSSFTWTPFDGTPRLSSSQLQTAFADAAAVVNGGLDESNLDAEAQLAATQLAEAQSLVVWTFGVNVNGNIGALTRTIPVWQEMVLKGSSLWRRLKTGTGPVHCSATVEALAGKPNGSASRVLWKDDFDDDEAAKLQHWSYRPNAADIILPAQSFVRVTLSAVSANIHYLRLHLYLARKLVGVR